MFCNVVSSVRVDYMAAAEVVYLVYPIDLTI